MNSTRSTSRRFHMLAAIATAGLIVITLTLLVAAFAKSNAWLVADSFTKETTSNYETFSTGTWTVTDGAFTLSNPSIIGDAIAGNANLSVNQKKFSANQWRLQTAAKAVAGTQADFSIVFDYLDEANYYFVNFSTKSTPTSNGIFKVLGGETTKLIDLQSPITAEQVYHLELRKHNDTVRVYRNKTLVAQIITTTYENVRVGYGSRGGAAVFDNLFVSGAGKVDNPAPHPAPEALQPAPEPAAAAATPEPTPIPTANGGRNIHVSNTAQLVSAISTAQPGDIINLADGTYDGKMVSPMTINGNKIYGGLVATTSGTADKPIVVQGSHNAIVTGGGLDGHYGIHLYKVSHWHLRGFTVSDAQKGIVLDDSSHNLIDDIKVRNTHNEGIRLRAFSRDNTVQRSYIHHTGLTKKGLVNGLGKGIMIGSASSSWNVYTKGQIDSSDRNRVLSTAINYTAGEGIDIREGAKNGLVQANTFDNAGISGSNFANSWIHIKGNDWSITNNRGTTAKQDGFQVHSPYSGWGNNNTFNNNTADVKATGYGFWLQPSVAGNTVLCNNTVINAEAGFATIACKNSLR